jgi:RTX calcium-binding nonapeptide repeat (4 copies)
MTRRLQITGTQDARGVLLALAWLFVLGASLCAASGASLGHPVRAHAAMANHSGWPQINGMLLMNASDHSRPLDGRPGYGPFDGSDPSYSCDGTHRFNRCLRGGSLPWRFGPNTPYSACLSTKPSCWRNTVPADIGHNELLCGHGNDTIHAGPDGDVIWGDYKPSGQPGTQHDLLFGGSGNDWIYSSHGATDIWTGAGNDHVMLVYGHGTVHCNGPGHKLLVMRKLKSNRHFQLIGCTHKTIIPYAA